MIEVSSLSFDYPGARALDAVSFALPERSITALVGPNGAGKTTLLRCIAALEEPLSGDIRVDGVDVLEHPRETHQRIGYLPDHFGLYQELSAQQCLIYAARSRGLTGAQVTARVNEVATQLEIQSRLSDKAGSLSRGQRQRLAIAQAIIHQPRVLLLDEPASGLDPESRSGLSSLMRKLSEQGMTLLVSSHILAELEEYCTAMLVLREGRIIEHRQLANPNLSTRRLSLRLSAEDSRLAEILGRQPGLSGLRLNGAGAEFDFSGDDAQQQALLRVLIESGLPLVEFSAAQASMQDAYMAAVHASSAPAGGS